MNAHERPALWRHVQNAHEQLGSISRVIRVVAEEGYTSSGGGLSRTGRISGPRPESSAPASGDSEARADYLGICQLLARADCLMDMAAGQSPRLAYTRSGFSQATSKRRYGPSVGEAIKLCQRLRAGLQGAYDVRVERTEATRRLREALRAINRAYNISQEYRQ